MTASTEELNAGQKAYQRIKAAGRYKTTPRTWVVVILGVGFMVRVAIHDGNTAVGAFWTLYLAAVVFKHWRQKIRCEKDYALLEQLKLKYGPEIYAEIKTEPTSLYFQIFQKLYPPDSRRVSVTLP